MSGKSSAAAALPRQTVSQSDFPTVTLEKAAAIARCIWDNFAGKGAAAHDVAIAAELSPTSSNWRVLANAAIAYGLTTGGWNAKEINLTDLGRRLVAPLEEGADLRARAEAVLRPRVYKEFFSRYDAAKFPKDDVAKNVLVSLGLPKDRTDDSLEILKLNGRYSGLIREIKSGLFVSVNPASPLRIKPDEQNNPLPDANFAESLPPSESASNVQIASTQEKSATRRVFITHGKNTKILEQIKEIVRYGKQEPIVSVERETVSKPVPDKVMEDMRSCQAAVIHVAGDGVLADQDGTLVPQINGNVLIEIGAAMALYGRKFLLLVEEGVKLPSNLQGLYECRYKGDSLDGFATMKLLKAFNEFS